MKKIILILAIIGGLFVLYGFVTYNSLVTLNEQVKSQWAQVETQYQRRFDLIPNLVESVKGIMKQEQAVFTAIADARAHYAGAQTIDDKAKAAGEVESALGRLLVITENYPQLKSSDTVQTLMAQLEGTENRISVERKRFNDLAQTFNVKVKTFPSSLVAKMAGFSERSYFEAASGAENTPKVSL